MVNHQFSRYQSIRVESLAIHFLQKICYKIGLPNPDDGEAKIIVGSCDIKTAILKIKKYSQSRHAGKFGPLKDDLQKKLNLKLAMYDISNKSTKEKALLIAQFVKENDEFFAQRKKLDIKQEFILKMIKGVKEFDIGFSWFLRRTDHLYNIRKNQLRRTITNDEDFNKACQTLTGIFTQYINRAINLALEESDAVT